MYESRSQVDLTKNSNLFSEFVPFRYVTIDTLEIEHVYNPMLCVCVLEKNGKSVVLPLPTIIDLSKLSTPSVGEVYNSLELLHIRYKDSNVHIISNIINICDS